jgi:hypothetical protein
MSPVDVELAYRTALRALPDYQPSRHALDGVLRALPPPPPGASVAERHARLRQVIEELLALGPTNALEAMLASQIVICRHSAADSTRRSVDGTLTQPLAAQMRRSGEALLRVAGQAERLLKKQQARRVPRGQVPAEVTFDLEALDAVWCGTTHRPTEATHETSASGQVLPVADSGRTCAVQQPDPIERPKFTLCGQRIDLVRLGTLPAAGTA